MEIWGGIECTINRVKDQYFDQLIYQRHYDRPTDIDLLISLGIKKVRYPILWEKHAGEESKLITWGIIGENLLRLQDAGIEVIAGLVHHGSGPSYVDIREVSFVEGLARFASAVATQFPWIKYYTPINEPLTTARFCGLYGLWHPHGKSGAEFLRILIQQCKATTAAMHAIHEINPTARLVQTEDLGMIHSTPLLSYQAEFENERKWLGLDLICGKVDENHVLWSYLLSNDVSHEELEFFQNNPCVPATLGFNYYITSERYLDEHIELYPLHTHGENGIHRYADIEVVRCASLKSKGLKLLLKEAWQRYGIPVAVTEAHLCCGREEQLRWIAQIWDSANELVAEGVTVEGVTIWALFGAYGWDSLLTKAFGNYESGAFDISSGAPRRTAIGKMISELAQKGKFEHPVLNQQGWWERESRIMYPTNGLKEDVCKASSCPPILVIGATGTLGFAFSRKLAERNIHAFTLNRSQLNITDPISIEAIINQYKPWAIINAAGFVDVDKAEDSREDCFLSNTLGPSNLAKACRMHGIKLVTFSSDLVFDGEKRTGYIESDAVNPLNVYGLSKVSAEEHVMAYNEDALIIRTSAFFGPWDKYNFVAYIVDGLKKNTAMHLANDVYISPTYVPDLVDRTIDLLIDDEKGIWHLSNEGALTWYELARDVANRSNKGTDLLHPRPISSLGLTALRPKFSVLRSSRGISMPSLENALSRLFDFSQEELFKAPY